jgi:Tol biopolymer transport system component
MAARIGTRWITALVVVGAISNVCLGRKPDSVTALAFTADSKQLFVGNSNGTVSIIDLASGKSVKSFKGPKALFAAKMSPKGDRLAGVCLVQEDVLLWDTSTWKSLSKLSTDCPVSCIAFSPDGAMIAAGLRDNWINVWDARSGNTKRGFVGHITYPNDLSFSPDGKLLASVSRSEVFGSPIVLWDVRARKRVKVIISHDSGVSAVAFLPDGKRIASAGHDSRPADSTIKIWDIENMTQWKLLRGHTNFVSVMVPLPNDRLLSASGDYTVRLWDLTTASELKRIGRKEFGDDIPETLVLSPDGKWLACGFISTTGNYKIWKLSDVFPEAVDSR